MSICQCLKCREERESRPTPEPAPEENVAQHMNYAREKLAEERLRRVTPIPEPISDGDFDAGMQMLNGPTPDDIAAPAHYVEWRTIEPRVAIVEWCLSWYLGNVVKYVARAGRKSDALRDLRKAQQYLAWEIERLVAEREGNQ